MLWPSAQRPPIVNANSGNSSPVAIDSSRQSPMLLPEVRREGHQSTEHWSGESLFDSFVYQQFRALLRSKGKSF